MKSDEPIPERWSKGMLEVLSLSWPASLCMLNATLMRFVDALMVSKLGPETSAAQFLAGLSSFVPESLATGLLTVVNTYVSQNFGAGRNRRCGQYAWAGLWVALAFSLLVAPLALVARQIFGLFPAASQTPLTIDLEVMYFRYMVLCIFFTLLSQPLQQFFYGIGRPRVVLASSIIANVVNLALGYGLIFGVWGLPRMELRGAAIAAMISWILLLAILAALFLSRQMHQKYATRLARASGWRQVRDILRTGWPAGVQFLNDVLPWTIFCGAIVGMFGHEHFEASTFAMRWMPLSFMPAVGIGIATTALVGRYIGQGRPDLARRRARAALTIAMVYMGLCGIAFWLLREPMIRFFVTMPTGTGANLAQLQAEAERIVHIGGQVMICAAVFQLFDAVGIVFMGALRGAGDTFWPMIFTILSSWIMTIGGGLAVAWAFPQLGSIGPWLAASGYVVILGFVLARRFESGQWRKINLLDRR